MPELRVGDVSSRGKTTEYTIMPARLRTNGWPYPVDARRMLKVRGRIETMAKRQLGRNFKSLKPLNGDMLILSVATGTSKAKRFQFRDLVGWIHLFDAD